MVHDLSMKALQVPGLRDYTPELGTLKDIDTSLTTLEVVNNMSLPYRRKFLLTDGDTVAGPVEADATICYTATSSQILDLKAIQGKEGVRLDFVLDGTGSLELLLSNDGGDDNTVTINSVNPICTIFPRMITDVQSGWVAFSGGSSSGGGGVSATNTYHYTFVVDSDEALANWVNNVMTAGQDYTSVLIRKGEWTSTVGINLTTTGTKVVVGEAGSKLVFNNVEKGLYYDDTPSTADYYMQGVNVEVTKDITGPGYGFYNCSNLTNCTGTSALAGYGFYNCSNLTNCTGTGTGTGTSALAGYGFSYCSNLTNCTGTGTGTSALAGYGFSYCSNLTNCTGTGNGNGKGFGFYNCNCVICCKAGKNCTTAVFEHSYASPRGTDTYACADTANGGFNNTTNPAA